MIFYFSGTGNSQLVAKQIAEITGDKICSINSYLKKNKSAIFYSKQPMVFVAPTYAWRIPKVVEKWIYKSHFKGNNILYFILTCGGGCGNASAYAKKICKKKGMFYYGLASVVMPENYVAMFPTPDESECHYIIEKAKPQIKKLATKIKKGKPFPKSQITLKDKLLSGIVNLLYYPLIVHDRGFTVSNECISCGKCAKRCPLENINIVNGKPIWKGNCTHCMACIGGCPKEAIEYKLNSKGKRRYYIMED